MLALWIYLGLTAAVFLRLCVVIHRDGALPAVGWKRVLKVVILDTIKWPYYVLRYGLESLLNDLK